LSDFWRPLLLKQARGSEAKIEETTYRAWRLMCAAAWGFQTGQLKLYQTLLVKTDESPRVPQRQPDAEACFRDAH